ncbi:hypothetical protein C8R43DRAFT_888300 [Mycena crocata]|nr:hypothetical protein C8R43DRAFT_888300 [Mycena crocata]
MLSPFNSWLTLSHREPAPLVDADNYVFALLAGGPHDPNWDASVTEQAARMMEEAAHEIYGDTFLSGSYGETEPRRGPFHAKTVGGSMGGGQETPTGFFHCVFHTLVLATLLASEPFRRLAKFTNNMFKCYAPILHEHYRSTMDALYAWNPALPRNYDEFTSVFAAATFNFGPFTVSLPHLDFANLAWGWCAVTALGRFNPDLGGHLILWDLRIVIRFPPGSTILIPSAILRHSNATIQEGETRYSFTQYTAAGIFRFVYNKFRTEKSCKGMSPAEKAVRDQDRKNRWFEGLEMYSKWNVAFE